MPADYDDEDRPRRRPRNEDDEDDRPARRRPRDDDDDDRPRRNTRDEDGRDSAPAGKKMSVLGLLSLLGGIGSLIMSFMSCCPYIGYATILSAVVGLFMGIGGLVVGSKSNHGKGMPIAGTVLNLLALIIAIVQVAVFGNIGKAITKMNEQDAQRKQELESGEAIKIPASKLAQEFDTNIVNADAKYKSKLVEVSGRVITVDKGRAGKYVVQLGDDNNSLECEFSISNKDQLVGVDIGKKITVRGFCKGKPKRDDYARIENCTIAKEAEPQAPGKTIPATTTEVVKAYQDNEVSADDKYQNKVLELSGKVARVSKGTGNTITVFLKGGGDEDFEEIFCEFDKSAADPLKKFTVGKDVKLTGTCEGRRNGTITLVNCSLPK